MDMENIECHHMTKPQAGVLKGKGQKTYHLHCVALSWLFVRRLNIKMFDNNNFSY